MKLSEVFAGFFKAAAESGIAIEADAVTGEPLQAQTAELVSAPAVDTSAIEAEQAAMKTQLDAANAEIARMQAEARAQRLTTLAATFHGDVAGHVSVLTKLGEDSAEFAAYVQQQQAVAEALRQSALFAPQGSAQRGGGGAWASIEAKAKALMNERPGLTIEQATVQVMDTDPALYDQYKSEQR